MSGTIPARQYVPVLYPDSDGKPMSDNTKQARWMMTLKGNLDALFSARADVFVAMDLLWYAVEGEPRERTAPDVMVVFGRPKGDRGSYKQWEEAGVPVTVAFEILSPGNDAFEMADKQAFYEEHGVEEYYIYDPETNRFQAFRREGTVLRRAQVTGGYVSPRMCIRFDLAGEEMVVRYPDGHRFQTFEEVVADRNRAGRERDEAQKELDQAQKQRDDAQKQRDDAQKQRDDAQKQRDEAIRRAARMGELLDKVFAQAATPEDRAELDRLRREASPE